MGGCESRLEKAEEGIPELEGEFENIRQNAAQKKQTWEMQEKCWDKMETCNMCPIWPPEKEREIMGQA